MPSRHNPPHKRPHGKSKSTSKSKGGPPLIEGRLSVHRDGFGFVIPDKPVAGMVGDIFLPREEAERAMHGDRVAVRIQRLDGDGKTEGKIVEVKRRAHPTVVGEFRIRRKGAFVVPHDARLRNWIEIPEDMAIPKPSKSVNRVGDHVGINVDNSAATVHSLEDMEGMIVNAEILDFGEDGDRPIGRVIEILGKPNDFGIDVEILIRSHHIPHRFPEDVLEQAQNISHTIPAEEIAKRTDFRQFNIVTIDGETARDFDDAVRVEKLPNGNWALEVHIADVGHYVRPGSPIDREARLRGTSVYFPDRAVPMLPVELSTDQCSLLPNEDRLVMSALLEIDPRGDIVGQQFMRGVIRSAERMTYTAVHGVLEGDASLRERYARLVPEFEAMRDLAAILNRKRVRRGSIDFDLPEPLLEFDEAGEMTGITRAPRNNAHRLIEEFMLAANEAVAAHLEALGPAIFRIHERPDPKRVMDFEDIAAQFGYSLTAGPAPVKKFRETRGGQGRLRDKRFGETTIAVDNPNITSRSYQKLVAKLEGKPEERILSYLMLRSLRQARYSEINEGHFALAAPSYTHFTSPIRRYPDLIVHRISKALLRAGIGGEGVIAHGRHSSPWTHPNEGLAGVRITQPRAATNESIEPPIPEAELAQIAEETSLTERRAAEAERELVEWKKVRFMEDRVGEEFAALVLNPAKYGLFVELTDMFVEGLVPIDTLRDDRYTWRENTHEIIGERTGRRFRAGDRVQVILDRILAQERRLQFSIVEEGLQLTGRKPARPASKPKKNKRNGAAPASKGKKHLRRKGKRR